MFKTILIILVAYIAVCFIGNTAMMIHASWRIRKLDQEMKAALKASQNTKKRIRAKKKRNK